MKIISSELYVKDNKVYHEGNKPKPKDIGAAPETHTHNYASATTPGGSAEHAIKATEDSLGQRIDKYIKGLSVSGRTITYTRGDGTTETITTQDNDTKVTNTLNTTAKAYITGTTESATNTGTQVFDTNVYLDTTAGMLTATTFKGALQGNAATATSATSASHAAKLTTPRSINGTNFDGTAAITTANWGTARTLTIGNTGKSVNGSGNVSWSIGEIGAAPTVHNHTSLTGITNLSFAAEGTDSASIETTIDGANTYFDFTLSDDPSQNDMWRWRFRPSGANVFNAMTLDAISTIEAKLAVTGEVQATRLKGTLTGDVKGNVTGTVSGNAGSATKLATARTINGTSFDGTGDITTANWGTARTITIGKTGKSVNGSGNVSWSLSEIGAIEMYNIPNSASSKNYSRICTMPANIGTGQGGLSAIIMGASNYGGTEIPLIKLSFSTRGYSGSGTIPSNVVNAVALGQGNNIGDLSFITKLVNNTVELWMSASPYPYPIKMIVFNNSQITMNCDSNTTTAPTGTITTHTIAKAYTSAHKPSAADVGALPLAGSTMTGPIKFNSSATSSDASAPTQLAYGLLGSYGNLKILANTDNNAGADNEYVHIAAARGLSPDTNQGIVVYGTYANAFGSRIVTEASGTAKTAVKLATARTINGTSFDGTANITTANWGTARNIQIGNAVKSVNGSGNVTWNWSEMQVPRAYSSSYSFGGNQNAITTAQFITMLTNLGAFSQVYWVSRGSWSYASNQYINDTGCGNIHLAGCVVEVIGNTSAYTIRVTTPTTSASGTTNAEFIYVNNGTDYSPGWRRQYNTKNKPTASEIGAAASNHTHSYLPLSGGTMTGAITVSGESIFHNGTYTDPWHGTGCAIKASGHVAVGGQIKATSTITAPTFAGALSGNASTATKLQTARTIALGGILSGSASFDGSGNVIINATANDITTITKSLNVTTSWMDTGIAGSNLATGTYAVQMLVNDGANTNQWSEHYSGIMSWFNGNTNSTDADEILLHKAGHASNGRHTYLRTIRTGNPGSLKLQISCTHAFSAASNITFKFKKLI